MKRTYKILVIIIALAIIFVCKIPEIRAEEVGIESININVNIVEGGNVEIQGEYCIYNPGNQPIKQINLFTNYGNLLNLAVYDDKGKLETDIIKQQENINAKILLRESIESGSRYTFNVKLTFDGLTEIKNDQYVTRVYIPSVARTRSPEELLRPNEAQHLVADNVKISILLPENMFFHGSVPQTKINKNSNLTKLTWEGEGSSKPGSFIINYGESPKSFTNEHLIYIIMALVLCICIIVLILNLRKPKKGKKFD